GRILGITSKAAHDSIMTAATGNFLYVVWGRATVIDPGMGNPPYSFFLSDGAMYWANNTWNPGKIRVIAPGHSVVTGNLAKARGTLDLSSSPPTLNSAAGLTTVYN